MEGSSARNLCLPFPDDPPTALLTLDRRPAIADGRAAMAGDPSSEEGARVAVLRMHGLTGEI